MRDAFQTERMRALRRDSYRCQHRLRDGSPCLKRTAHVAYVDTDGPLTADNLTAFCRGGDH